MVAVVGAVVVVVVMVDAASAVGAVADGRGAWDAVSASSSMCVARCMLLGLGIVCGGGAGGQGPAPPLVTWHR